MYDVIYFLTPDVADCHLWMCALTACDEGYWGAGCAQLCNCKDVTTYCNVTFGCDECLSGWTGGNCDQDVDECLEVGHWQNDSTYSL